MLLDTHFKTASLLSRPFLVQLFPKAQALILFNTPIETTLGGMKVLELCSEASALWHLQTSTAQPPGVHSNLAARQAFTGQQCIPRVAQSRGEKSSHFRACFRDETGATCNKPLAA